MAREAYLRLAGSEGQGFESRAHFYGASGEAMRRILVENARRKKGHKHGGHDRRVETDEADLSVEGISDNISLRTVLESLLTSHENG